MIFGRIRRLLEPGSAQTIRVGSGYAMPEVCDPIPEEHRLVIPLKDPSPLPNLTIQGRFADDGILVMDRRSSPGTKFSVYSDPRSEPLQGISLQIGEIKQGRVSITVAGPNVDLKVGHSVRLFCRFGLGVDSVVRMGDQTTSSGFEVSCAQGRVIIGRDCQTAAESMIMGAAHHGIVDLSSGTAVLQQQSPDVVIGNHVWLGYRCYVGGRARIGDGCIVAAQASVVSPMPANCLIAGNPATVRRKNVGWSRAPHAFDPGSKAYFAQLKLEENV